MFKGMNNLKQLHQHVYKLFILYADLFFSQNVDVQYCCIYGVYLQYTHIRRLIVFFVVKGENEIKNTQQTVCRSQILTVGPD